MRFLVILDCVWEENVTQTALSMVSAEARKCRTQGNINPPTERIPSLPESVMEEGLKYVLSEVKIFFLVLKEFPLLLNSLHVASESQG